MLRQSRGHFIEAMSSELTLHHKRANQLEPSTGKEIHQLCNDAYGEDLSHLFAPYTANFRVLARMENKLFGHAMVVTRWVQAGKEPALRTVYVEMVATAPEYRKGGVGSDVMKRVAQAAAVEEYELAALCPGDTGHFVHPGWEYWRGPLFIRIRDLPENETPALIPTPEERVRILRFPFTPPLDLDQTLSAEWRPGGSFGNQLTRWEVTDAGRYSLQQPFPSAGPSKRLS